MLGEASPLNSLLWFHCLYKMLNFNFSIKIYIHWGNDAWARSVNQIIYYHCIIQCLPFISLLFLWKRCCFIYSLLYIFQIMTKYRPNGKPKISYTLKTRFTDKLITSENIESKKFLPIFFQMCGSELDAKHSPISPARQLLGCLPHQGLHSSRVSSHPCW